MKQLFLRSLPLSFTLMLSLWLAACATDGHSNAADPMPAIQIPGRQPPESGLSINNRPFHMGFTTWPMDTTVEGVQSSYAFIEKHADIVAAHLDGGIPWQEMLDRKPLPRHIQNDIQLIQSLRPKNRPLYLAATPLNTARTGLANYRDTAENQPLPTSWKNLPFNHPKVKQAYVNYLLTLIEAFHPDYLAIGIESNILLAKNESQWRAYQELNTTTYAEIKKHYPTLPVFVTIQYEFLKGIENDARHNHPRQKPEVMALMQHSDMLGISTYQYGNLHHAMPDDYFNELTQYGKPIAIAESGAISQELKVAGMKLPASESDQAHFERVLLASALRDRYIFVINWCGMDFDRLVNRLPAELRDLASIWSHTGLANANGTPKPALRTWDTYLNAPYEHRATRNGPQGLSAPKMP